MAGWAKRVGRQAVSYSSLPADRIVTRKPYYCTVLYVASTVAVHLSIMYVGRYLLRQLQYNVAPGEKKRSSC